MQTTNQSPLGLVSTLTTGQQSKAENDQSHIVTQLHGKHAYVYSGPEPGWCQKYRDGCDLFIRLVVFMEKYHNNYSS